MDRWISLTSASCLIYSSTFRNERKEKFICYSVCWNACNRMHFAITTGPIRRGRQTCQQLDSWCLFICQRKFILSSSSASAFVYIREAAGKSVPTCKCSTRAKKVELNLVRTCVCVCVLLCTLDRTIRSMSLCGSNWTIFVSVVRGGQTIKDRLYNFCSNCVIVCDALSNWMFFRQNASRLNYSSDRTLAFIHNEETKMWT